MSLCHGPNDWYFTIIGVESQVLPHSFGRINNVDLTCTAMHGVTFVHLLSHRAPSVSSFDSYHSPAQCTLVRHFIQSIYITSIRVIVYVFQFLLCFYSYVSLVVVLLMLPVVPFIPIYNIIWFINKTKYITSSIPLYLISLLHYILSDANCLLKVF